MLLRKVDWSNDMGGEQNLNVPPVKTWKEEPCTDAGEEKHGTEPAGGGRDA